jgi:hypothetical protein
MGHERIYSCSHDHTDNRMKFSLGTILNSLRNLYTLHGEPEHIRRLADIFWRALLLIVLLYLVLCITYGEWLLYNVLHDSETIPAQTLPPAPLDRASIDATLSGLQAREDHYNSLKAHPNVAVPDPSK